MPFTQEIKLSLVLVIALLIPCFSQTQGKFHQEKVVVMQQSDSITNETIKHHFSSFINNDLEEILSDYTEESIIITPEREYKGLEEIRSLFMNAFLVYPKKETSITIDKFVSIDNFNYVVWHGETPTFTVDFSTATYLVIKGKIFRHSIGRVVIPKE